MKNTAPRKTIFVLTVLLCICLSGLAKDDVANSIWTNTAVLMDGSAADWENCPVTLYKKRQVEYAFQNNGVFLFVLLKFNDPEYLSSIEQTGMTIYYNVQGKRKKDLGVVFKRLRLTPVQVIALLEQKQALTEEQKKEIQAKPAYDIRTCDVFNIKADKSKQQEIPTGEFLEASFGLAKSQAAVVYEFAIPLEKPFAMAHGIGTEPGQSIKIGFEWGGLTEEMKKRRMQAVESMSEGDATAGATSRTRGYAKGGDNPGSQFGRRGPKEYEFWVDVKLASGGEKSF